MPANRGALIKGGAYTGPGLLDYISDAYKNKLRLLGGSPEREAGLLTVARSGDEQASNQWFRETMASPFMGFGVGNIKAYHGSPHRFSQFSTKNIGTGEGAQAYGHGLYFAESPKVAQKYANDLTQMRVSAAKRALEKTGQNVDEAISAARNNIDRLKAIPHGGGHIGRQARQIAIQEEKIAELTALKKSGAMSKPNLYEVNIKPDPPDFLDWDKPLSQQSEKVRKGLDRAGYITSAPTDAQYGASLRRLGRYLNSDDYKQTWRNSEDARREFNKFIDAWDAGGDGAAKEWLKSNPQSAPARAGKIAVIRGGDVSVGPEGARALRQAGIRGIRYKDAGSRGKDEGTYNYVVFDDADVEILGVK